jgi:radical SAM superfamily enzyme YgiQ (UPF0313 family)
MKNIQLLSLTGWNDFIPVLWPSAKTFYELYGKYPEKYNWVLPITEVYTDIEENKRMLALNPPDILGVSLYVWNYDRTIALLRWAKEQWPNCLIITGGPHQYFKHHSDWFQKNWFIDASLPSEVYGEIAITDILDNLKDDNTVNWNNVEQMVYPSKDRSLMMRSPKATYKRDFRWDYSAFEAQRESLQEYVNFYHENADQPILHSKIETTRGCPYECTFCDWGGGVGTKVVLKDLDCVKRDLDVLLSFDISSVYVCDANFGINGERDVEIIQYIADKKKEYINKTFPNVQYGGYAKTNKHFDFLKRIFTIEATNKLSYVYKISQQSFNDQILKNVKRTDLRSNEHFELADYLRTEFGYEATIEIIIGLPGTTLDTWYNEFNIPYEKQILVRAYEWYLLPEAESFEKEYRDKWGIKTALKRANQLTDGIPSEIVVEGGTFTRDDYKEFTTAYSLYIFFNQSGVYRKSIKELLKIKNMRFGDFLRQFYHECYPLLKLASMESFTHFENHLDELVSDETNETFHNLKWLNNNGPQVHRFIYFIIEYFKHYENLGPIVENWFIENGVTSSLVRSESELIYSAKRLNTTQGFIKKISFDLYKDEREFYEDVMRSSQYTYGNLLVAEKRVLGATINWGF